VSHGMRHIHGLALCFGELPGSPVAAGGAHRPFTSAAWLGPTAHFNWRETAGVSSLGFPPRITGHCALLLLARKAFVAWCAKLGVALRPPSNANALSSRCALPCCLCARLFGSCPTSGLCDCLRCCGVCGSILASQNDRHVRICLHSLEGVVGGAWHHAVKIPKAPEATHINRIKFKRASATFWNENKEP